MRLVRRQTVRKLQDLSNHSDTVLQPSNTVPTVMAGATQSRPRNCASHDESHAEHHLVELHADRHQPVLQKF